MDLALCVCWLKLHCHVGQKSIGSQKMLSHDCMSYPCSLACMQKLESRATQAKEGVVVTGCDSAACRNIQ